MISEEYRELNRELHSRGNYGRGGHRWAGEVERIKEQYGCATVLDYGAGQGTLAAALPFPIAEYDPAIEGKEGDPEPVDLVVCTDVLEHIEPEHLDTVLKHLHSKAKKAALIAIATRPAVKCLADGRNAHLIIESAEWWRERLEPFFVFSEWRVEPGQAVGIGEPIIEIGELKIKGALSDDTRFENTKRNIAAVHARVRPKLPHNRVAVLACYGPSLAETWANVQMERPAGTLVTVSGAHDFLIRRGIVPDSHIECDPRPHKAAMVTPSMRVKYLLASCCDAEWVAGLVGNNHNVVLWHMINGTPDWRIDDIEPGSYYVSGGGSVGLRAVTLLYALGYRRFIIHGMDCSFINNEQHAAEHTGKKQKQIRVRCGERWFDTSPVLVSYARQFFETLKFLTDATFDLHGDGLLQAMCRAAVEQQANGSNGHSGDGQRQSA